MATEPDWDASVDNTATGALNFLAQGVVGRAKLIATTLVQAVAGAYANGDCLGAKFTLTDAIRVAGGTAILHSIDIADKGGNLDAVDCHLYFFNADPTSSTFTDNSAFAINDADAFKVAYVHKAVTTDWKEPVGGGNSYYSAANIGKQVDSATVNLFCAIEIRGVATIANGDIQVRVGFLQD